MKAKLGLSFLSLTFFILALVNCVSNPTAKVTSTGEQTINQAQLEPYSGPKARISVAKFVSKSVRGLDQINQGMADMLSTALFNTNRFIVLEGQNIQDLLA
jgi:curli biogenesis system outer membrane secretion channel CsgG